MSITENNFICDNKMPLYIFYCRVHGNSLLWEVNNEEDIVFLPFDTVGRTEFNRIITSNGSSPVFNVTATLTHISLAKMPDNNSTIPVCVSLLTVQSFNESQFEVILLTVTCQSHCHAG